MDNLQYINGLVEALDPILESFKPCYKWIIFNIYWDPQWFYTDFYRFKPCYKWIIFNIGKTCYVA